MTALKDILEGKPVRSPLHPALVHLPIALFPLSVLLDLASWVWPRPEWQLVPAAFVSLVAGIVTGLLAAVAGVVDYTEIRADHPAKRKATVHMVLNVAAIGLFALGAGLRFGDLQEISTPGAPLLVSLIGLAILSYSGYLGGHLVYNEGIAVGRHRRATRLPATTIKATEREGAYLAVAAEDTLPEGGTLRVDAEGTVVTLTRAEGQLHAFQEFCPHRYGPLSEGEVVGCEIVCPWHRSRFDVRTGEVTQGPAKVGLRTFGVQVRDGRIWVEMPVTPPAPPPP